MILSLTLLLSAPAARPVEEPPQSPPNFVFILADDLGWGEVGAYGQSKIRTPNLDRLAAEGMRFTQHYSGSPVCAPSRFVLMSGLHSGHAYVRGNKEVGGWGPDEPEGQLPIPEQTVTLAERLREHGYRNAAVGKWGLGGPGSSGHPLFQGFDRFYGYLCQRVAHNYYPTHLWDGHDVDVLDGNRWFAAHQKIERAPAEAEVWERYSGLHYAPDRMIDEALDFVRASANQPFLLYFATPVPHAAIQVPQDSLAEYDAQFDDGPYLGERGYLPHPQPRAGYAAMVSRMDRDVGRLIDLLEELELSEHTLVIFTSDNGPTFNGGTDSEYFESSGPFRGLKTTLWEGGIRVPTLARWPGRIPAGEVSEHLSGFQDWVPTLVELAGGEVPQGLDGISLVPTLTGEGKQRQHDYLYWEYPERGGSQAVRRGQWKALRQDLHKGELSTQLFDLQADCGESRDLAAEHPKVLAELEQLMREARHPSDHFPIAVLDDE